MATENRETGIDTWERCPAGLRGGQVSRGTENPPGGTFLIEVPSFPMTLASDKLIQDCPAQPLSYLQENCPGEAPPR